MASAKDLLTHNMSFCREILIGYVSDMSDAELFMRPTPTTNHIAWQLGHLIASEHSMLAAMGASAPALAGDFAASYTKETSTSNDPKKFHTKAQYLDLLEKVRKATLSALEATKDADLDKPAPEKMRSYAPTVLSVYHLIGSHELMHAGQFVPLRRMLGKPVLF